MSRLFFILILFILNAFAVEAGPSSPKELKDLYFGEALY